MCCVDDNMIGDLLITISRRVVTKTRLGTREDVEDMVQNLSLFGWKMYKKMADKGEKIESLPDWLFVVLYRRMLELLDKFEAPVVYVDFDVTGPSYIPE